MHSSIQTLTVRLSFATSAGDSTELDITLSRHGDTFSSDFTSLPLSAFDPSFASAYNGLMRELSSCFEGCMFMSI